MSCLHEHCINSTKEREEEEGRRTNGSDVEVERRIFFGRHGFVGDPDSFGDDVGARVDEDLGRGGGERVSRGVVAGRSGEWEEEE